MFLEQFFWFIGTYDLHNSIMKEIIFSSPYNQFSDVPSFLPGIGKFKLSLCKLYPLILDLFSTIYLNIFSSGYAAEVCIHG